MNENDIIQRINLLCNSKGWSNYKLAKESNIPYSSLMNMIKRNTMPTLSTLEKICIGFNISLADFFAFQKDQPIQDHYSTDEQDLVNMYRALEQNDQKLVKAYIQGMRRL